MNSILIIGGLGMLGSQVVKELSNSSFKVTATYRNYRDLQKFKKKYFSISKRVYFNKFDIRKSNETSISKLIQGKNFIINCAGVIKPHIKENSVNSVENAIIVNSIFPHKLNNTIKNKNIKIYQIATDCVFSGLKGGYTEKDKHDAFDVYGRSKSLGEVQSKNFFNLRCSIIGNELKNNMSLIEWFKSSKANAKLNGFRNHKWNGITTIAYAKLIRAIIEKNINLPNNFHILPKDTLSKYQLLVLFSKVYKRDDLKINKVDSKNNVDRTLKTLYRKKNLELWKKSVYLKVPNIEKLIKELN